ncbi:hypothetical protein B0H34DRAFT_716531 [Crassisporium funariophilum]|nr:hypothetical protein B0H34DRAFT_716531 [Crassisporium funariophilum]
MYAYPPRNRQLPCPISNLPVELLSYIFSLSTHATGEHDLSAAQDQSYSPPIITTESVQVPLVLSRVNRHWRRVALGTPGLWSSLCITTELLDSGRLDTTHITSYLALSRNYPLNILIDARDQDWDFYEPEVASEYGLESYTPPISSEHMNTIASLLIPHLSRWKSLSMLTDTWSPMHAALTSINPHIARCGAPLLESLTLMRCNDYISFSPQFQPEHMKEPAFLQRGSCTASPKNMLPRLKHLSLRGVHVDWDSLIDSLSASETGLASLEMASHCADVRPSLGQFHKLLSSSPALHHLLVFGSGSNIPEESGDGSEAVHWEHNYEPVHLPQLRQISIGYRCAFEGHTLLELLDAPNARTLTLEDASYPGDPEEVDASSMLTYIGTKEVRDDAPEHNICTHDCQAKIETRTEKEKPRAAFPLLESVTLKGVKACPRPLRAFFGALPNLHHLELTRMSMQAAHALLPSPVPTPTASPPPSCPCPHLTSLCIKASDHLPAPDLETLVSNLAAARQRRGACGLREVDIHVDAPREVPARVSRVGAGGMKVNIFNDSSDDEDDEDEEEMDVDKEMELGGVFNDPVFDAHYSLQIMAR